MRLKCKRSYDDKLTTVTISTRPIALHSRRSNLSLVDVNQVFQEEKIVNIVC